VPNYMPISSKPFGWEVCQAIGLPKGTADFSIHFPVSGAVTVKAELYLSAEAGEKVKKILREYEVRERPDYSQGGLIPPGGAPHIVGEGPQPSLSIDARPSTPEALERIKSAIATMDESIVRGAVRNERVRAEIAALTKKPKPATLLQWLVRNFRA
jgi:hypothetical protein